MVRGARGKKVVTWIIIPVAPFKGGSDTEFEVAAYCDGMNDRSRGEPRPMLTSDDNENTDYMAGWNGDVTYARGIIDAVTGVPLAHPGNPAYVAGYTYQPRPKSKWRNRATPRTYSGPRS